MLSIFLAMLFLGVTVNITALLINETAVGHTLDRLIESTGSEYNPEQDYSMSLSDIFLPAYNRNDFYVFQFDENGEFQSVFSNVRDEYDGDLLAGFAERCVPNRDRSGQYMGYYYKKHTLDDNTVAIAFLDGSMVIATQLRSVCLTILICLLGLVITFFLMKKFSNRAIQPEMENSRRQKEFVTNASHELKTPLAVIRTNTEMMEILQGKSEWTRSTIKQVDHLNGLIQNLVMIARSQEREDRRELSEISVSKAIAETIDPYEQLAIQSGLKICRDIEDNVRIVADESKIRQLTTLLIDNALKYCDEEGMVQVSLHSLKNSKGIQLVIANSYAKGEDIDYSRFFDRFYREDPSHNIDKGGYGIGLSIAESICRQYEGNIYAKWKAGSIWFVCTIK